MSASQLARAEISPGDYAGEKYTYSTSMHMGECVRWFRKGVMQAKNADLYCLCNLNDTLEWKMC